MQWRAICWDFRYVRVICFYSVHELRVRARYISHYPEKNITATELRPFWLPIIILMDDFFFKFSAYTGPSREVAAPLCKCRPCQFYAPAKRFLHVKFAGAFLCAAHTAHPPRDGPEQHTHYWYAAVIWKYPGTWKLHCFNGSQMEMLSCKGSFDMNLCWILWQLSITPCYYAFSYTHKTYSLTHSIPCFMKTISDAEWYI